MPAIQLFSRMTIIMIVTLLLGACAGQPSKPKEHYFSIDDFPNVLNVRNIPLAAEDWSAFAFFDQGAWFGFALPPEDQREFYGVFPGPFISTHGRWLGQRLLGVEIADADTGISIPLSSAEQLGIYYYPGRLVQRYRLPELTIELTLIFVSNRIAAVEATVQNTVNKTRRYILSWSGKPFEIPGLPLKQTVLGEQIRWSLGELPLHLQLSSPGSDVNVLPENGYRLKTPVLTLGKKETQTRHLNIIFEMAEQDAVGIEATVQSMPEALPGLLKGNRVRWDHYLNRVLNAKSVWYESAVYRQMAVKALLTLINNWKSAYGDLLYDGLFPSYAVHYFDGFWAWDSWKHAAALARFDVEIAKNQVRTMFAYQNERGMIADVIYADKSLNNWRDTKPPLAAWAVWEIYAQSHDAAFVREMLPKLLKYHQWWYQDRDHDENGLCEYGSTDGSLVAALWESGMDDAVRYDDREMLKNSDAAWSLDLESVDLNAYLYAEKLYLVRLAEVVDEVQAAKKLRDEAEPLKLIVQHQMFSTDTGFFHDIDLKDKKIHKSFGPEGWIPVWANLASKSQAEQVKDVILDRDKFNTYIPLPTVSKDNPKFMTGYWRGPVWLDQAYFGIKGLMNYGYDAEAERLTRVLFERAEGLINSPAPIRENYDPRDGKGLKVNHFSWSAAHLMLLYRGE